MDVSHSPAPRLSIVIPARDEAPRIGRSLDAVIAFAAASGGAAEIVVVDDGSSDGTSGAVASREDEATRRGCTLRLLRNATNRGKGFSVKRGFLAATGDVVLFTDADLSSPIEDAPKLIGPIASGEADVVFGSRAIDRSLIGRRQPVVRDFGGRLFNLIMRAVTGLPYRDTQCGFKAFRRRELAPVFEAQRIDGFGFDAEILYVARKRGLRLREVPVRWNDSPGSKVRFVSDAARMCADLVRIRINDARGRYGPAAPGRG
jgi:glycosyltransferase involved in cell wall biosynthesis